MRWLTIVAGALVISLVALAAWFSGELQESVAVHDVGFELDGNVATDGDIDWEDLFDVPSLPDPPTPKAALPGNFKTATFIRDFVPGETGPDPSTYTTGSKDILNISTGWECTGANKPAPPKDDILNAYAAFSANGDTILYFGFERFKNNGDANVGFWFLQDPTVGCTAIDPPGTGGGSTASFTGDHVDGDLLVVSEFTNGGVVNAINVYQWVGDAGGALNTTPIASAADCASAALGDDFCAITNDSAFTPAWLTQSDENPSTLLDISEFFEGGINLTSLNLEACFSTFMAVTRSSQELPSALHDFALGGFELCDLQVTKTGTPLSKVTDDADYTITITNNGAIPLFKDDISDTLLGDITINGADQAAVAPVTSLVNNCGVSLAPSASCTITATRTLQPGDDASDGNADGFVDNTVTVVYNSDPGFVGAEVTRSADHSVELFQPSITLDKTGPDQSKVGDGVVYTVVIANTSSTNSPNLIIDTISDTLQGDLTVAANFDSNDCGADLAPSASCTIVYTYTVLGNDPDPLLNTASVETHPENFDNDIDANDGHSVDLFGPSITLDKTGPDRSKVGDDVNYTITLGNTSSPTSPDLECTVTDALLGINESVTLAFGEQHVINASRTVQANDPDPLVNTADVTCSPIGFPNILTATASHSVNLFQPSITLDKTADTSQSKVGDDVNYTITLDNTSSDDSPDLECTVTDALLGINDTVTLPSGGQHVINASRTVESGDPDPLVNTADVTCSPIGFPNILTDSDSHSVDLFGPNISLTKTGDTLSKVGDVVNYTITLDNTSSDDSPDLECTVTDALLGISESVTLASGGQHVINASRTVQAGDPDPLINTADASCSPIGFPNVLTATATHSVELFQPSITLFKECSPDSGSIGDTIVYTLTISNTSSDDSPDLNLVSASDSLLGDVVANFPATLAPDDTVVIVLDRDVQDGDSNPLENTVDVTYQVAGFPNQLSASDSCSVAVVAVAAVVAPVALPPTGGLGALADDSSALILLALIGATLIGGSAWIIWSNRRWDSKHRNG